MSRPRSHHKRGPKPKEPYTLARVTSLRQCGFTEAKVNRTERKIMHPKQSKVAIRENKALLKCIELGLL